MKFSPATTLYVDCAALNGLPVFPSTRLHPAEAHCILDNGTRHVLPLTGKDYLPDDIRARVRHVFVHLDVYQQLREKIAGDLRAVESAG